MKRIVLIIIAVLSLTSCVKEKFSDATYSEKLDIKLRINTRTAEANAEDAINKVRIIAIANSGLMVFNSIVTPTNLSGTDEYALTTLIGQNHFYVICNEDAALATKLNAARTPQAIESATFNYTTPVVAPFVMVGRVDGYIKKINNGITIDFTRADGTVVTNSDKLIVDMNRVVSKVSLSFIKNVESGTDFEITNLQAKIGQMPKYGYVGMSNQYPETTWLPDYSLTKKTSSSSSLLENGTGDFNTITNEFDIIGDHIDMADFYIPEHYLSTANDPNKATYILITADAKVNLDIIKVNWRINIEDNGSYNVQRNTHYKILAKISGLGAVGLHADIKMATVHDVVVDWELIDGLVILSDKKSDYGKKIDIWNDYNTYTGILKLNANNVCNDVFFKYGSVVGIDNNSSIFSPANVSWSPSNFLTTIGGWGDIPYASGGNVAANIAAGLGDPCKLVRLSMDQISSGIIDNKQWHMATEEEMNRLVLTSDSRDPSFAQDNRGYNAYHSLLIPSTKSRDKDGNLTNVANWGGYWTSQGGKAFTFNSATNTSSIAVASQFDQALSVRCVRNIVAPVSWMSASNPSAIAYGGNTAGGVQFNVSSDIPYWTATLITSGGNMGTSSAFDDFSLATGSGSRVHSVKGSKNQALKVYMSRFVSTSSRTFKILVSGVGHKGEKIERIVTAQQNGYKWSAGISSLAAGTKIPKAGATYSFTVYIGPSDITLPTGHTVGISAYANGAILSGAPARQTIVPGKYSYTFQIPIPANTLPDERNVSINSSSTLPGVATRSVSYYQNNK